MRSRLLKLLCQSALGVVCFCSVAACFGQQVSPAPRFAPGILTTIAPDLDRGDAISIHNLVEVLAQPDLEWTPVTTAVSRTLYGMAKKAAFVEDIWCLELTFKPLRMLEVDVPMENGQLARKLVWYMVYRVRNTGAGLAAKVGADGKFVTTPAATPKIRFIPQFVLSVRGGEAGDGETHFRKAYLDRLTPAALGPIERREFGGRKLLTSVQMPKVELAADADGAGVWGVAMWLDVDPETDFFSVYVTGLTNANRWQEPAQGFRAGDPAGTGRSFARKALQLNFWRPGDQYGENEREIRFGVPPGKAALYDSGEGVAHRWIFR